MNPRIAKLQQLSTHSWYSKLLKKITESEFDTIVEFCEDHADLNQLEFEYAANRLFLGRERPKHFAIINEILVVVSYAK